MRRFDYIEARAGFVEYISLAKWHLQEKLYFTYILESLQKLNFPSAGDNSMGSVIECCGLHVFATCLESPLKKNHEAA